MNKEHKSFLKSIVSYFVKEFTKKFLKGYEEHDGNLFTLSELKLIDEAIAECLDQYTFLMALRKKIEERQLDNFRYHKEPKGRQVGTYIYENPVNKKSPYTPKFKKFDINGTNQVYYGDISR